LIHDRKDLADHTYRDLVDEVLEDVHVIKSAILEGGSRAHELDEWKDLDVLLAEISQRNQALHVELDTIRREREARRILSSHVRRRSSPVARGPHP
jgi:hypothetical protein